MPHITAKEQFDRQAEHYDSQWNSWSEETLAWLVEAAEPKPADTALDVATGAGFTACALAPLVSHVTATDVSTGMLREARQRAAASNLSNIEFVEAPAEKIPLPDASTDIVACRIAAHHFLNVPAFVNESARVLKPGGRFLLVDTTVPDGDTPVGRWKNEIEALRDPSHVRNIPEEEWRRMVQDAGLTVVESTISGKGITIGIDDWLRKAGVSPEVARDIRQRFAQAPDEVKEAFKIAAVDGRTVFTWMRILLKAVKA